MTARMTYINFPKSQMFYNKIQNGYIVRIKKENIFSIKDIPEGFDTFNIGSTHNMPTFACSTVSATLWSSGIVALCGTVDACGHVLLVF